MSRKPRNITAWINVILAALLMVATLPGRTQGLGLVTEPLLRDLQLDRVQYATINLWATLIGAIVCLPVGWLFDRVGLRAATTAIVVLLGVVVWRMSGQANGVAMLFLLVLGTRALGQSALSISSITAVGKSFPPDRVGPAMGVYSVAVTVGFAVSFTAVGAVISSQGWRTAWSDIAFALVFLVAPLTLFFLRLPHASAASGEARDEQAMEGISLVDALKTPAFWVFAGATALFGLVTSGLGLFNESVLADRGFDQHTYFLFLSATAVVGLVGQMFAGWITTRWSMQRLLALGLLFYAIGLGWLPLIRTAAELWTVAALAGVSGGIITVVFFAVWSHAFGRLHLGWIQGAAQMLTVLSSAIGPLLFASSKATTGSYTPVLWTLAPIVLALAAAAFRVSLPSRGTQSANALILESV